jgi:predicted N-acetyltransferase YhbS
VAWLERPLTPPAEVRLVELDEELAGRASRLVTYHFQERFVASVASSYRDALFARPAPRRPWMRGVLADGELVAFVMVAWPAVAEQEPRLWRLLVDRRHQRRGVGTRVVGLVVEELRAVGAGSLVVTWRPGRAGPAPFFERLGFVPTGDLDGGEVVARLGW